MVLFLKVFLTEFIAEMGDKTQLMLIALTSKYKLKDIFLQFWFRFIYPNLDLVENHRSDLLLE